MSFPTEPSSERRPPQGARAKPAAVSTRVRETAAQVVASHRDADLAELFGIAELSSAFGITPRTIRFYEDKGLLSPRRVNGARIYTRRDRARLALILRSKAIGASLDEIRHFLDLYGDHGEGRERQLGYVLERTDAAIRALQEKRMHIDATLAELQLINQEVRRQLGQG